MFGAADQGGGVDAATVRRLLGELDLNLSPEQQSKTIFASCIGANVKNLAKGAR